MHRQETRWLNHVHRHELCWLNPVHRQRFAHKTSIYFTSSLSNLNQLLEYPYLLSHFALSDTPKQYQYSTTQCKLLYNIIHRCRLQIIITVFPAHKLFPSRAFENHITLLTRIAPSTNAIYSIPPTTPKNMQLLSVLLTAGVLSVTTVDALPRIVCQQNPDGSWNYPACAGRASGKVRRQQWSYREHTPVCMQLPNGSWNYSFCDFGGDANLSRLRCIQHPDGTWNYPECTTTVTDVFSPNDPWWNPLPYPGGPVPPSELDERSVEVEGLMRLPMESMYAPKYRD